MISLLSENDLKSTPYKEIQLEFQRLWLKLFLNKDRIDKAVYNSRLWMIKKTIYKLSRMFIILPLIMDSELILRSNQLWMPRCWEYPWAILNAQPASKRILDVGSGWSLFPLYLAQNNKVDAVDVDKFQMEKLSPLLADILRVKVNYKVGAAVELPMSDNTYDVVFSISVLEHLDHHRIITAIKECLRVAKHGGKVVLTLDYDSTGRDPDSCNYDDLLNIVNAFHLDAGRLKFTSDEILNFRQLWLDFFPYEIPNTDAGVVGIILEKN